LKKRIFHSQCRESGFRLRRYNDRAGTMSWASASADSAAAVRFLSAVTFAVGMLHAETVDLHVTCKQFARYL
jgi:hypothetical protein